MSTPTGAQTGLILSGGGARAAYQVGVLKAIAEILPHHVRNPFPILSGTSAGSINAAVLAASAPDFQAGVRGLVSVWSNFEVEQVFRTDVWSAASHSGRLILTMLTGGREGGGPRSLLDNSPLRELLAQRVHFDHIETAVNRGDLQALSVTSCSYTTGSSVSHFCGEETLRPWSRARREGARTRIDLEHLMASSAIPVLFPAVKIGSEYFGDGSMRQTSPISPALHLGAEKVLIIGVRQDTSTGDSSSTLPAQLPYPSIGQIGGYVLDTLFLNSLNADIERLERINQTLELVPVAQRGESSLKQVATFVISPSQDIGALAEPHMDLMPAAVQYLLRVVGARQDGGKRLLSYLLFNGVFCSELIELGVSDTLQRKDQLLEFLAT